jgi:hypothetical protein
MQIISTSKTQYLTPFFEIYKKMKFIIMTILYKLKIINGNIDYIKNISFIDVEWIHKLLV